MPLKYVLWAYIVFMHNMYKTAPLKSAITLYSSKSKATAFTTSLYSDCEKSNSFHFRHPE